MIALRSLLCVAKEPPYRKVDPRHDLVHAWRWDECRQLFQEFQWRQFDALCTIRPDPSESVEEIAPLVL